MHNTAQEAASLSPKWYVAGWQAHFSCHLDSHGHRRQGETFTIRSFTRNVVSPICSRLTPVTRDSVSQESPTAGRVQERGESEGLTVIVRIMVERPGSYSPSRNITTVGNDAHFRVVFPYETL